MPISSEQFEEIYLKHRSYVFGVCRANLWKHPELDPEDIVQNVFIKIFLGLGSFRESSPLEAWINTVTVNAIVDGIRRKQRRIATLPLDFVRVPIWSDSDRAHFEPSVPADQEGGLLRDEKRTETLETVWFLERKMRPGDFKLLYLKHIEGASIKEIAAACGIGISAAKSRVNRALLSARSLLGLGPQNGQSR